MGHRHDEHNVRTEPLEYELDAFLAGTYGEWLEQRGRRVPAWAWLNRVAHASMEELEFLAEGRHIDPDDDGPATLWQHVLTFLATEILDLAKTDREVLVLQLTALVPLELRLATSWWRPMVPLDLATDVMVALEGMANR